MSGAEKKMTTYRDVEKFIRSNTFDVQHAPCALSLCDIAFEAYAGEKISYSPEILFMRDNFFWQFVPESLLTAYAGKLIDKYRKDASWFANVFTEQERYFQASERAWRKQEAGGSRPDADAFAAFTESFSEWWEYGIVGDDKGRVAQENLEEILLSKYDFSKSQAEDLLNAVTHPDELSAFNQARVDFLTLCTGDDSEAAIRRYIENYFYTKSNYFDRTVLTVDTVREDIETEKSSRTIDEMDSERTSIQNGHAEIIRHKKELLATLSLEPEDSTLLVYLQYMAQWVDVRKVRMMKQVYWLFCFVHVFAEYAGVPYNEAARYMIDEIVALSRNIPVTKTVVEDRQKGFVIVYQTGSAPLTFMQPEAGRLFEALQKTNASQEVKGSVACRGTGGTIRGKVQIIKDPEKDIFIAGNILVTSMTRPEFVPLMKHALAIITDEGGIACHAAIVSRELKKPCIIGTKNATQILKDGDEVEVDTDKGIVRKL
ncbi:MAG: PEP-utilizing enzyme [Patescibacteria group bacterium]